MLLCYLHLFHSDAYYFSLHVLMVASYSLLSFHFILLGIAFIITSLAWRVQTSQNVLDNKAAICILNHEASLNIISRFTANSIQSSYGLGTKMIFAIFVYFVSKVKRPAFHLRRYFVSKNTIHDN